MKCIWCFSSYDMLETTYVVRKVKLDHSWEELVTLGGNLDQKSPNVAATAVPTTPTPSVSYELLHTPLSNIKSAPMLWILLFPVEGHWVTPHMFCFVQ